MTRDSDSKRRTPYHHGNLRQALVDNAVEMLSSTGAESLSLRAVARAAGVSHMAPYHHFDDKRGLLAAVAADGFRKLKAEMLARMAASPEPPNRRLQESAIASVLFANANPHHYRLMFGPLLVDRAELPELAKAAESAFRVVLDGLRSAGVEGAPATGPKSSDLPPEVGLAAWAMAHGLAMLVIDGQLQATTEREVESIARAATDLLWYGLSPG